MRVEGNGPLEVNERFGEPPGLGLQLPAPDVKGRQARLPAHGAVELGEAALEIRRTGLAARREDPVVAEIHPEGAIKVERGAGPVSYGAAGQRALVDREGIPRVDGDGAVD